MPALLHSAKHGPDLLDHEGEGTRQLPHLVSPTGSGGSRFPAATSPAAVVRRLRESVARWVTKMNATEMTAVTRRTTIRLTDPVRAKGAENSSRDSDEITVHGGGPLLYLRTSGGNIYIYEI